MRTTCLVLLGCCLALGTVGAGLADAALPHALIMDLTTPARQRTALLQLRDLADPALQGVLQALKEGALYLWKEETLLILNDTGTLSDLAPRARPRRSASPDGERPRRPGGGQRRPDA